MTERARDSAIGRGDRDSGFILVAILAALAVLSALAASFAFSTRLQTRISANASLLARLEAAADVGISASILKLIRRDQAVSQAVVPYACAFDDEIVLEVRVEDEAGKIDLNYGDERLLIHALLLAGAPRAEVETYVDRIVDFRDTDQLRRPRGAEASEYRAAGLAYEPKNSEFTTVEEVEQVLGLPEPVVAALRPFVTVHSRSIGIDISNAPPALLESIAGSANATDGARIGAAFFLLSPTAGQVPLPHELRASSNHTKYSVISTAQTRAGATFSRRAIVELTSLGSAPFKLLAFARSDQQILPGSLPKPPKPWCQS